MTQPWTPPTTTAAADGSAWSGPKEAEPLWGPPAAPAKGRSKVWWVVLVPAGIVGYFLVRLILGAAPPPVVEVDGRMAIAAPFEIGQSDALMENQFRQGFESQTGGQGLRDLGVRSILREGELVGYLVIADVGLNGSGDENEFRQGFEQGAPAQGATTERRSLDGMTLIVARTPDAVMAVWTRSPLAYMVFATDVESAEVMARAVVSAVPAGG
jgi:hypothetical protein